MSAKTDGFTMKLAQHARRVHHADLSADMRTLVRQSLLDYVGVTLAGVDEPSAKIVSDEMIAQGGRAEATVFGRNVRVPAMSASLANGTAAHALDFDDVNMTIPGHPAVAIFPALLAAAEEARSSGIAIAEAYVAGYDTMCRLGLAMGVEHYDAGFHATATLGSLAAAAACGRLFEFSDDAMAHALGLAAAQSAGLKSMFGTMTKPFNAGRASSNGLLAARLARRGFESRMDAVECDGGMAALMDAHFSPTVAFENREPGEFLKHNLFKFHAACYLVHSAIEAAADLRRQHDIAADRIESVIVRADRSLDGVCNIPSPWDATSAKFSLRAATAMALLGRDTASPATFGSYASDTAVRTLVDRVTVSLETGRSKNVCDVTVQLKDGSRHSCSRDSSSPEGDLARQDAALRRKFGALTETCLSRTASSHILELIAALEEMDDVTSLMELCAQTAME